MFLGQCAVSPFIISQLNSLSAAEDKFIDNVPAPVPSDSPETGKPYAGWKEGDLDLHYIYTGRAESSFQIFPDGTSMLLDAGEFHCAPDKSTAILPDGSRHAGEWIARYIKRVNPAGDHVDYMMCSHFHSDHCGIETYNAGKTSNSGADYFLSGFAQVGEYIHFDEVFDRAYPDYNAPVTAMKMRETANWLKFVEYQEKANGLKRTPFIVGRANQIALKKAPEKYKGQFQILNVCGNGAICLEAPKPEDEFNPNIVLPTENLMAKYPANHNGGRNENPLSLGFRLSYGKFRFYTGGDISGAILDDKGSDLGIEVLVGKTVGKVHVCKANHHASTNAMRAAFVKEVQARVYINNIWHKGHVNNKTMSIMTSRDLYPGDRIVCPTMYQVYNPDAFKNMPWQKDLVKIGGHVVVKAYDGGTKFKVYYLAANDESMTVKAVYGPWDC